MRILLVEDSTSLQRSLGIALRRSGHLVDVVGDGEEGLWRAEANDFDLIILDIMLPKKDGLSVLAELRRRGFDTHVLLLTARDTIQDRVNGLQIGADDYLVKPFALDELLARVRALGRRAYGSKRPLLRVGDLEIDTLARLARRGGRRLELTAREFLLLEYLVHRRGEVVSRTEIEGHIYDDSVEPLSNVVDSAICSLRKKITLPGEGSIIHTRRGMGYVLDEEPKS